MKKIIFFFVACSLLVFSSCSTIKRTATATDVQLAVCQYPTAVDLEVMEKVEAVKVWSFAPFHWGEPKVSVAKGNLIAETLSKHQADVLLEPQVTFSKVSYGERRIIVTGYLAKYKNFRKATKEDLEAIKAVNTPNERTVYNDGKGGLFGIIK